MNEAEMLAALKTAKQDYELRAAVLKSKMARAQRVIERSGARLLKLEEGFEKQVRELTQVYMGLPEGERQQPTERKRKARLSLDEPVLKFIRAMTTPIVSVPSVTDEWNRQHPDQEVGVSTMRGVMGRLVGNGYLEILDQGGPGRSKTTEYRVTGSQRADSEGDANVVAH